jgi:DNA-binding NarL/FixJ family response regulator
MNRLTFVVEDNPIIRDQLMPSLVDLAEADLVGFAENEADAIRWLTGKSNAWDDAVIDLFLKQGNGLGVLAAVRARRPDQRAIVLTNYCTEFMRTRCSALGAEAVFDKSTQLDEFFEYLRREVD